MAEQVQQQKALHLEADIRIDDDAEAVEDAGAWRLEIPILDHEPMFDDAGRHVDPEVHHVAARHVADQACADDFMTGEQFHGVPSSGLILYQRGSGSSSI